VFSGFGVHRYSLDVGHERSWASRPRGSRPCLRAGPPAEVTGQAVVAREVGPGVVRVTGVGRAETEAGVRRGRAPVESETDGSDHSAGGTLLVQVVDSETSSDETEEEVLPVSVRKRGRNVASEEVPIGMPYVAIGSGIAHDPAIDGKTELPWRYLGRPNGATLAAMKPVAFGSRQPIRAPLERVDAVAVCFRLRRNRRLEQYRRKLGIATSLYEVFNSSIGSLEAYYRTAAYPSNLIEKIIGWWRREHRRLVDIREKKIAAVVTCPVVTCKTVFGTRPPRIATVGGGCPAP
jgi:hypothetical protein